LPLFRKITLYPLIIIEAKVKEAVGGRKMDSKNDNNGQDDSYFVFREAANADELLQLFQLRYQVYRNSRLAKFVPFAW